MASPLHPTNQDDAAFAAAAPPTDAVTLSPRFLDRLRSGEREAFLGFFEAFRLPVFNFVRRFTQTDAEAAGVTREAFVATYRRILLREGALEPRPWLYQAAFALCRERGEASVDDGRPAPTRFGPRATRRARRAEANCAVASSRRCRRWVTATTPSCSCTTSTAFARRRSRRCSAWRSARAPPCCFRRARRSCAPSTNPPPTRAKPRADWPSRWRPARSGVPWQPTSCVGCEITPDTADRAARR